MYNFSLIHGKFNMNECVVAIKKMRIHEILEGKNFKKVQILLRRGHWTMHLAKCKNS
jgi:hypothetical protein